MLRLALVLLLFPGAALADDEYTDNTACTAMASSFDNQDSDGINQSVTYVENVFDALDSNHVENGDPGIVAQWSDNGLKSNVALVAEWCRQHPKETVYNAAAEVYDGLRSLEVELGTAK